MKPHLTTGSLAAVRRNPLVAWLLVGALTLAVAMPAQASIELIFGASSTSSNSPHTGASAKVLMTFVDTLVPGQVSLELLISNTTGVPPFGSGSTESMLTGFAIDLPSGVTLVGNLTTDLDGDSMAYLDTLVSPADFSPFGTLDLGIADDAKLGGGNANDALSAGSSDKVSVTLGGGTAATLEAAFLAALTDPDDDSYLLNSVVRFMQTNAGAGSDKLANPSVHFIPPGPPNSDVPEPTSVMVWAMSALIGIGAVRFRQLS